jgi:hypothetical protein
MGIFDIFNKDKEEEYKGVKLVSGVDSALQKQLIDKGRTSEIKSLAPEKTPSALQEFGRLNETDVFNKEVLKPAVNNILSNPTVQKGLEKTIGKLSVIDDYNSGRNVIGDNGSPVLVQDLPIAQQAAGAAFTSIKEVGRGFLGLYEGNLRALQWLGVDSAKPLADKLKEWEKVTAAENPTFAHNLVNGLGSMIGFWLPGMGIMKGAQMINSISPRIAMIFGNSAMTAFEAMSEAGQTWQEAIEAGKDRKEADSKANKTFWANAVLIGLTNKLAYFNNVTGLKKLLLSSPVEGLQEFGQQVIQNVNSGRKWDEGAYEAGLIGTILGGIFGAQDLGFEEGADKQLKIIDQKMLDPKMVESRLSDVAQKVGYILTGDMKTGVNTELGQKIMDLKNTELAHTDSPGQFFREVSKVLKADPSFNPRMLSVSEGLGGTVKDFNLQLSADDETYNAMIKQGKDFYVSTEEKETIKKLASRYKMPFQNMLEMVGMVRDMIGLEQKDKEEPEIMSEAVDTVKMENGQMPDIIQEAVNQAKKSVISVETSPAQSTPSAIYSQSSNDQSVTFSDKIKVENNQNQIEINPADFNLKNFKTFQEQKDYIASQNANNLSEAIQSEGKYDGFSITGDDNKTTYVVTNKEKLDKGLKSQQFISTQEARVLSKEFKFIEALDIPVITKSKILTPAGKEAYGRYYNGVIEFLNNPHKTTIPHEAVHAFIDLMVSDKQKQAILDEVKRRYAGKKYNDQQAEERLADDFVKYYQAKSKNENAKAPSNKLKQFFDWFITNLKNLVSKKNGDVIGKFYEDVINKKPGIIQKELIRRKITRRGKIIDLQKEYFQNPDALTTKFLENVDVKNREFSSYQFLKNLLKSKSLPLKEVERIFIDDILDTQFKDEKKINMDDFRNAVRSELMPLQVIMSDTYANYGMDNIGFDYDSSINPPETHIYNSPFNHGYTGHFSGDFKLEITISDLEIKQIPGQEKFAVIRKGVELNEDNIAENVYYLTNTKEAAEEWIEDRNMGNMGKDDRYVDIGKKGLFGHVRVWDTEDSKKENGIGNIRYIAEIQSDAFQNIERITDRNEKFFEYYKTEKEALDAFKKNNVGVYIIDEDGSERLAEEESEIKNAFEYNLQVGYEKTKPDTAEEKQFMQYKNTWFERIIREEIRRAAMDGKHKLRFPTPYTISKIEGYLGEEGQIPEGTQPGDSIEYGGDNYVLLIDNNEYNGENSGIVTREDNIRVIYNYDIVRQEDFDSQLNEYVYDLQQAKTSAEIKDIINDDLTADELKELKKYLKEDDQGAVEELITPIIDKRIDDQYTDAESYAKYNDENIGANFVFSTNDNRIIVLNKPETEVLGFGNTADKEDFNYEEDLESQEQRTVARFYDKQVSRYLQKLRKQNFREVTDDNGYDWYETDILPEDKIAVEAFQTKPADDPDKRTGKEVADYVNEIEKSKEENLDDYLRGIIEKQNFLLTSIKIDDVIKNDEDLKEYIKANENRYEDGTGLDPNLPIVIGYWEKPNSVIDGYNRVLTKLQNGDEYIEAFVAENIKYQTSDDAKRLELEIKRGELSDRMEKEISQREQEILNARETSLVFNDSEKEAGYQNFKKLAARRKWVLEDSSDENNLKYRLRGINIDDYLFSGATDITNDELLEKFKDRYFAEEELAALAKEKTPTEQTIADKLLVSKIVKDETIGRKPTMKQAINVALGVEKPIAITMKETTLLKKKIRDMARGVTIGRQTMRTELLNAFRTKLDDIQDMKKASINYAKNISPENRGDFIQMINSIKTQKDLAKAFMRIDAAIQKEEKLSQINELKDTAQEVKKSIKNGKGIAVEYQKQIIDIINGYDLKKPTSKTLIKLQSLKKYLDSNPGFIPDYVVKKLERLSKKRVAEMSIEEIKELNETLNHLASLGHLKLQLKNRYDERQRQVSLARLITTTNSLDPRGDPKNESYRVKESKIRTMINLLHSFRVTDKIDGYLEYKGQNTAWQKKINRQVSNAELTANSLLRGVFDEIKAIKNDWTDKEQAIMEFHLLIQQGAHTQANELATLEGWKEAPKLTTEMELAMDLMRGTFQKTEGYLAAVYEEVNNKPFERVNNYFPLKYEQKKTEIPEPTIGQKIMRSSKTEQGFTMKRLQNVKRSPRTDVFAQFEEAVREQQYYMQVQPILLEAQTLINDDAYQSKAGRVATNWWKDYIDAMANRGQMSGVRSNVWLRKKRIQLSRAIIGYKLSSIFMQPMAIFDAIAYIQMAYGQIAAARTLLHFAYTWVNPFYARKVKRLSPAIELRNGGELAIEEIQQIARSKKAGDKFARGSMALLQWADIKTAASVDQGMFKILKSQGLSDSDARAEADMVMNIVSGSSEIADRPMVLMSGEAMRTLFTFQTFMLNRWGLISHDIYKSGIIKGSFGKKSKALYALFILALAGGVENELRKKIYEFITGGKINDSLSFWKNAFYSIPESVPILGQIFQSINHPGQSYSIPLVKTIENAFVGASMLKSSDPEKVKKGLLKLGEAVATYNGVPGASQAEDILERPMLNSKTKINNDFPELPELPEIELPELPALPELPTL